MSSSPRTSSRVDELKRASGDFQGRFVRVGAVILGTLTALSIVGGLLTKDIVSVVTGALGLLLHVTTYLLTLRPRDRVGRRLFVYGILVMALVSSALSTGPRPENPTMALVAAIIVGLAGFLLSRRELHLISVAGFLLLLVGMVKGNLAGDAPPGGLLGRVLTLLVFAALVAAVVLSNAHGQANLRRLALELEDIDRVMDHARRIAKGDLTGEVGGESEVSQTIRAMLAGLRDITTRTAEAAAALASSARELSAMAQQQAQGASAQASAVRQVHAALGKLVEQSNQAAKGTEDVRTSVERTQRTTETVSRRAAALSAHTNRISLLLEAIKNIANKSEMLALNAALEGARAGESGRGFSLVASQMQRLSESVMGAVGDARALLDDVATDSSATLAATEESTALSAQATAAAGRISVALREQRGGTEQVAAVMNDIEGVTAGVSAGTAQTLSATRDLTRLADELTRALERFKL